MPTQLRNRVVRVSRFGDPDGLEVVDAALPTANRGEVRVRVLASSLNYTEVLIRRLLRGVRGRIELRTEFVLRFDYGSVVPWVERLQEGGGLHAIAGPDRVVLRTPVRLYSHDFKTIGEFAVSRSDVVPFVLSHSPSHLPPPRTIDTERALADTEAFWHDWSDRCAAAGPWTEAVKRSLIVLRALTYAPTGGILAAPTTSLPEQAGGVRNWDYRYCWLRDATFTLLARSIAPATMTKRGIGRTGCCARSPVVRTSCRSCTGSAGSDV